MPLAYDAVVEGILKNEIENRCKKTFASERSDMESTIDKVFDQLPYEHLGKIKFLHLLAGAFAVGALLFIGFYLAFFTYLENTYDVLEKQKVDAEAKLKSYQSLLERKDMINIELVSVQGDLTQIKGQMPQRGDITDFVRRVTYVASALGVEIKLIKIMPEDTGDFYKVVPIEILVRGGFYKTAAFLEAVQNLLRVVNITELHMKTKTEKAPSRGALPQAEQTVLETYSVALAYSYIEGAENRPSPTKDKDNKDKKDVKKEG